jgi:glutamine amidotransferase
MHNGVIASFVSIARHLVSHLSTTAYSAISGSTDSEHFAALYISYLTDSGDRSTWENLYPESAIKAAMQKAIETVISLQKEHLDLATLEANSLNVCVTDGVKMLAIRFRNHEVEQPPSLYMSQEAGVTLNRKYPDTAEGPTKRTAEQKSAANHRKHVILASEPTTYKKDEWVLVPKNHSVIVDHLGNPRIEKLDCPKEWMASAKAKGF